MSKVIRSSKTKTNLTTVSSEIAMLETTKLEDMQNMYVDPPAVAPNSSESATESATESAQELWFTIQTKNQDLFDNISSKTTTFVKENQQLLTALGLVLLGIISLRLLFATLNAIESIPLMTPLLKIVGAFYVGRFVWRYLIRQSDRHDLMEAVKRTKAEVLGDRS
jgi:CAAD domains of cyanobacterial aminoacyl-tRNA synthetase